MTLRRSNVAFAAGFPRTPRRTDKILKAITDELNGRQGTINADASIRSVTVVVKLKQGSDDPRCVLLTVETERTLGESD